ncbi:MAG: hypothetical protein V1722_00110 [Candidatus Micrarchaeota archaeon]
MKRALLEPEQIIGFNDYPPLHSPKALSVYYQLYKNEKYAAIPPVPLIPAELVLKHFKKNKAGFRFIQKVWKEFAARHPNAKYFQVDGKHRASAACLAGKPISTVIIKNNKDVQKLLSMQASGKLRLTGLLDLTKAALLNSFEATLNEVEEHFFKYKKFLTVREKTKAMIANGDVPQYMIANFAKRR